MRCIFQFHQKVNSAVNHFLKLEAFRRCLNGKANLGRHVVFGNEHAAHDQIVFQSLGRLRALDGLQSHR